MNCVRWSMGDASLHGMGTSSVPGQCFGCYPCPWTKLLPMSPDRTPWPNHALQRTAAGRRGCNRRASWPPSLSLGRWADLGELGLCRSRLQRRRMLRLVDAEFPAAWQRKPRDRAPALLVDGRALHVLLLHLGGERLHVLAH